MSKKVKTLPKVEEISKAISKKELESITINQTGVQKILLDLGSLEAQKSEVIKEYEKYSVTLNQIKTDLEDKYGQVNINLRDGTYTPIEKKEEEEK
tara:strand:- start:760 stop:1047 length:288 start_codon:yes stop_codon:yes gene_type:complete